MLTRRSRQCANENQLGHHRPNQRPTESHHKLPQPSLAPEAAKHGRESEELDIPVLRVGGGLKIFLSKQVAFKIEYRYERYLYENTITYFHYSYTYEETSNYHNVLFGFSVFLPGAE